MLICKVLEINFILSLIFFVKTMSEISKKLFKIFSVILQQFLETAGKDLLDFPNFGKGKK